MTRQLLDITNAPDWWPAAQDLLEAMGSDQPVDSLVGHCMNTQGQLLAARSGARLHALAVLGPGARTASAELSFVFSRLGHEASIEFLVAVTRHAAAKGVLEVHVRGGLTRAVLEACGYSPGADGAHVWTAAGHARQVVRDQVRRLGPGAWAVVLHNDEVTTFDFVTATLMGVCGYGYPLAWALAVRAHFDQRCVVALRRKQAEAEEVLALIRLAAMRAELPLLATVEHLPD